MRLKSPAEIIAGLQTGDLKPREILLILGGWVFLRNVLEGILEKQHLFGFNPYPYNSFLIFFIHFPLFYLCVFLTMVLVLTHYLRSGEGPPAERFGRTGLAVARMFWLILLPPVIDVLVSGGRGYDMSYILSTTDVGPFLASLVMPWRSVGGITIGMKIEIYLALAGGFTWMMVKRRSILRAVAGTLVIYAVLAFLAVMPLLVAWSLGMGFAECYATGGLLLYDTQKFAALFFLVFVLLSLTSGLVYRRVRLTAVLRPSVTRTVLTTIFLGGVAYGIVLFLRVHPGFFSALDYVGLALIPMIGYLSMHDQHDAAAVAAGLAASFIISYYLFLGLTGVVILQALARRATGLRRGLILGAAAVAAFTAGLTVVGHERVWSMVAAADPGMKTSSQEEAILTDLADSCRTQGFVRILHQRPHFVAPGAVTYLAGIHHLALQERELAVRMIEGALALGHRTAAVYLTLGDLKQELQMYDEALAAYRAIGRRGWDEPLVDRSLGSVFYHEGRLDSAAHYYERALARSQDDTGILNNLGVVYMKGGRYESAQRCFERALLLDPESVPARHNLALLAQIVR